MTELSSTEKELLLKKNERAVRLREEFRKQLSNPHRQGTGEGGTVFDAGMQRFQAMRVNYYEHFKPCGRSFKLGMLTILPIFAFAYGLKAERDAREQKYRTGQVAYKDRGFKFI